MVALYIKQVVAQNDLLLRVAEQTRLEKLDNYEDRWPLLHYRNSISRIRIYINMWAYSIIKTKIFENSTIAVILANSITLSMEDPLAVSTTAT